MKKSRTKNIIKTYETIGTICIIIGSICSTIIGAFEVRPFTLGSICGLVASFSLFFIGWYIINDASKYRKRNKK